MQGGEVGWEVGSWNLVDLEIRMGKTDGFMMTL